MVRLSVLLHAPTCQAAAIERALRTLMRGTRLEPGCLSCQVWTTAAEDAPARTELHYEERWVNEQAMEGRVRSESFNQILELLEAAVAMPLVEFDFVSRRLGLEYVEEVRRVSERH